MNIRKIYFVLLLLALTSLVKVNAKEPHEYTDTELTAAGWSQSQINKLRATASSLNSGVSDNSQTVQSTSAKSQISLPACTKVKNSNYKKLQDIALAAAISKNDNEGLRKALKSGADPHHVLCNKSTSSVDATGFELLFNAGIDPTYLCFLGHGLGPNGTALSTAELLERTRYLISRGADVDCTYGKEDSEAFPLIHSVVRQIGDKRFNEIDDNRKGILLEILKTDAVNHLNGYYRGSSVLSYIGLLGWPKHNRWLLDTLMDNGLDPDIQTKYDDERGRPYGKTVLARVVTELTRMEKKSYKQIVENYENYVSRGTNPNETYFLKRSSKEMETFMDGIDERRHTDLLIELMGRGAKFHKKDELNQ